jgi:hypothetical protein
MKARYFIAPLIAAVMFFVGISYTMAQEESNALSLGYAPVSQELHLNQGDSYSDKVVIWNLTDNDIEYFIVVRGFKQIEDYPGTAILLTEEQDMKSLTSASSWVRFETESIIVPSQMNFELNYVIQVPEDAADGEYYAQIFFYTDQSLIGTDSVVTLNNLGGGPTFLIKTGDDFTEKLEILDFKATKKIYERPEVVFNTSISNTGNTHLKPQGVIVLKNMFNQELAVIEFNPNRQAIIRDTLATYISEWQSNYLFTDEGKFAFGPITAELMITYTSESPGYSPATAETTFWILQWKLGLAILGGIIVIIWGIVALKKSRRRKKAGEPEVTANPVAETTTPPVVDPAVQQEPVTEHTIPAMPSEEPKSDAEEKKEPTNT